MSSAPTTAARLRATRYVASLRPAMWPEAARIARQHVAEGTRVDDALAILELLDALIPA